MMMTNWSKIYLESPKFIQQMIQDFQFWWDKVALIGNRGHQNFGDELILIWNIKFISQMVSQNKSDHHISSKNLRYIIYSANISWLKKFHDCFDIDISSIKYLQEVPHGFRSLLNYISHVSNISSFKHWVNTQTYILGWGEIFTPETPFSYQYRTISLAPYFFGKIFGWLWWYRPKLIVMWGIQKPTRWFDKLCFGLIWRCADRFYLRDKESVEVIKNQRPHKKVSLFVDSSYFAVADIHKQESGNKIAIFNTNPLSNNLDIMINKIKDYYDRGYEIYFLPAYFTSHGAQDDMSVYSHISSKLWPVDIRLLDWRDWDSFIEIFKKADYVYASRLHIYIVARLIWLEVEPFKYQKKLQKMIDMLDNAGL